MPALLWAQSSLPYVSTVFEISASTALVLVTSTWTKVASPPFSVIIWTVCCPPSAFMSAMISFAPSRAKVRAVALPIPDAPPVTNATLPSTRPAMSRPPVYTYRYRPREDTTLRLGVRNSVFLTPRDGNLSQSCITISVPLFGNSVRVNPVFEVTERASPTYGVTQIVPYVLIIHRETESLHNTVLIDLELVRQREIVIRLYNLPSNTDGVMLPVREVFEGFVMLSST